MQDIFLTNYTKQTFLEKIKQSLNECSSFSFTVSFIKKAGLVLLECEIEEALSRGANGKIITSTYQNFTDIASLETFLRWMKKYPNFSCHIDFECFGDNGFHSKGYLFEYRDSYEFVVGSSNITRFALLKNIEWNVSLHSKSQAESIDNAFCEFDNIWNRTLLLSADIIKKYRIILDYAIDKWDMDYFNPETKSIKPNSMQRRALKELRRYRDTGVSKALIIAATGSGKTYLASFDARNYDAKRLLFIVHRDAILTAARDTFMKVFGVEVTYGLYTGSKQDLDCDFLFATNTMLSAHLDNFKPDEFDYIVYDECHHASASTYQKIMKYFKPGFSLGLTATPERMDNQDVFDLFEKNVPFELRLRDAIINDLVVPFHYYAIKDSYVDYSYSDKMKISNQIAQTINVDFITKQIEEHKKNNEKLKCLAFCTNIAHCTLMADELSVMGYSTIALTGTNNLGERIKAFSDLQDDANELEIICTVDILNEGVDIPGVNMVLFLRPTESSTIFLQQLGRGLRKYPGKDYVTVLDFIGNNYERSVQIALALGTLGKTTYAEKEYLKDMIRTDFASLQIPGVEIFFDDLSKTDIISFIDKQNFNKGDFLKKDYQNFKKYLNKDGYPTHMDYLDSDIAPDLMRFMKSSIKGSKNKSYYSFLKKIEEESIPSFDDEQVKLIDFISDLLPIVRVDEFIILKQLLNNKVIDLDLLVGYNKLVTINTLNHALYILNKKNILKDEALNCNNLSNDLVLYLNDLLDYGIARCEIEFSNYDTKFKLYGNYYKEQIMMVLEEKSLMYMKGTKFDNNGNTYCFVGLKKDKSKEEKTNYKDKFIDSNLFQWESENDTTTTNSIGLKLINTKKVYLFVRKMDDEDGITLPFTYFGTGVFKNMRETENITINGNKKTLTFDILLDNKVPEDYYLDFNIPEIIES